MRPFLLALLVGSALFAPTASADPVTSECHKFVYCTIYGPDGEKVVSVEDIL